MRLVARIGFFNQLPIKPLLAHAGFVSGNKQNRAAPRIEGKSDASHAASGIKAQFLHVAVFRSTERVNPRPAQLRAELLEQLSMRQNLILDVDWELIPFRLQFIRDFDGPAHSIL